MNKLYIKNKYGVVPTHILNNKSLSLAAKGLYAFMQSKPDGWVFSIPRLQSQLKEGKTAILSAIKELEKEGLLIRKPKKDITGKFDGYEYILLENKQNSDEGAVENPSADFRMTDFPLVENLCNISKKDYSKIDYSKIDYSKKDYSIDCTAIKEEPENCTQLSNDNFMPSTASKTISKIAFEENAFKGIEELIPKWKEAYHLVDVEQEIKKMEAWVLSQPRSRWKKDWKRFINNWLSREQDRKEMRQGKGGKTIHDW